MSFTPTRWILFLAFAFWNTACSSSVPAPKVVGTPTPVPHWISDWQYSPERICGLGMAGPGFPGSPYPADAARSRALRNLAGSIETAVQEAMIAMQRESGSHVTLVRHFEIDDALLQHVSERAAVDFWQDALGEGPFLQPGFTYSRACLDAVPGLEDTALDAMVERALREQTTPDLAPLPKWLTYKGTQPGGKLCAVGFSPPAFYAEQTFQNVVGDVQGQLAEIIQTLVSEYQLDVAGSTELNEIMTVASSQGVSEGVVVTHYWFDEGGTGPMAQKGTTYGWGCIYPNRILRSAVESAESILPAQEQDILEAVRNRAQNAFKHLQEAELREP